MASERIVLRPETDRGRLAAKRRPGDVRVCLNTIRMALDSTTQVSCDGTHEA